VIAFATLENAKVAITGANGYIGSALVESLDDLSSQANGAQARILGQRAAWRNLEADVRTFDCWKEVVEHAEVIYHLAAKTSVYGAEREPVESLNSALLPLIHLVRAAREFGRKPRVVFASTATVYGLTNALPISEALAPAPITSYDLHKHFSEQYLALATRNGVLEGVSLRLSNVYGPSSRASSANDRGILNKVTAAAMQGRDLTVFGDGDYLRDYVYIGDVVKAFLLAGTTPGMGGKPFNVTSGMGTTIRNAFELVVDEVAIVTGKRVRCESAPWPPDADEIEFRNFVGSNERLAAATGWKPSVDLRTGIKALIAGYHERREQ
jgi:nucleoside-diphosphate-sugar epimerase